MDKNNLAIVRESFGRVVYSHKIHEKAAEIEDQKTTVIKWVNIILTAITSGTLISNIITNQVAWIYISAMLSAVTLGFTIYQFSFNSAEQSEKHRCLAKELWYIREKYTNLIADIMNEQITADLIISRRDHLIEELKLIYKFAPQTDSKSYDLAKKALKVNEELTFSDEEIDQFLPNELKVKK